MQPFGMRHETLITRHSAMGSKHTATLDPDHHEVAKSYGDHPSIILRAAISEEGMHSTSLSCFLSGTTTGSSWHDHAHQGIKE